MKLAVTHHAKARGRERLSLKLSSVERMAVMALDRGVVISETAGQLRRYLDNKLASHANTTLRIYGEVVFIFGRRNELITCWQLPNEFKATVKKIRQARKEPETRNQKPETPEASRGR